MATNANIWRIIMAIFAVAWLCVAIAVAWEHALILIALIAVLSAAGNACASWFGFERHRHLVLALAIVSSALDVVLVGLVVVFCVFAYALSTGDWSGLAGVH